VKGKLAVFRKKILSRASNKPKLYILEEDMCKIVCKNLVKSESNQESKEKRKRPANKKAEEAQEEPDEEEFDLAERMVEVL